MPLTVLNLGSTQVNDLAPLKGMPLTQLNLLGSRARDLSPLIGMPLDDLYFYSRTTRKSPTCRH